MQQQKEKTQPCNDKQSLSLSLSPLLLSSLPSISSVSYYIYFTVYYFYIIILHQILTTVGMKPADDATQTLLRVHKEQDKLKTHLGLFFILFLLLFILYKYIHTHTQKRGLILLHIKNY
ncbi:hypothetical protein BCV71DRAFT_79694 [Rhizopus microsporus]|uniref:Uncharacterized protein n=1 Tax=Rhizopus microsporus TaxID=58291 RepID=A0A1X0S8K9_RHIZD|nr:hypothetical protein BCV71DRAFT_79694 [Rhizopus microsporus]